MELLKYLAQESAVSGNEENIIDYIKKFANDFADEVYTDTLGNLIVHKPGKGKKLMLCAHTDEIGVMVTFIDENGFLRFAPVGGVDINTILNRRVKFSNGQIGVISYENSIDVKKDLNFSKLYIDIGCTDERSASERVSVGDVAVFDAEFESLGCRFVGKSLDNRAGVYVLMNVLKNCSESAFDTYFVFSVQEEIGLRGARTAAFAINPDYSVSIDVTDTGDTPNCKNNCVCLGKGPAIKIMDKSVICHPAIRRAMEKCAKALDISVQKEVLSFGGTDAGAIHTTGDGVITGAVSVPLRYMHSTCETVDKSDLDNCIKLITGFLNDNYID
jgi:endoglucanase